MKKIIIAICLTAGVAWVANLYAATFNVLPCTPLFVANNQGRPISDGTFSVATPAGVDISGSIWSNPEGTTPYSNRTIPTSQIIQFYYGTAGIYQVSVSGGGVNKSYYVTCGVTSGTNLVSVYKGANQINITTSMPPALDQTTDRIPELLYDNTEGEDESAFIDFLMPSYALVLSGVVLEWNTTATVCHTTWVLDWCTYSTNEPTCVTTGAHQATVSSSASTTTQGMVLATILGTSWTTGWPVNSHVRIDIIDHVNSQSCLVTSDLVGVRMEFVK